MRSVFRAMVFITLCVFVLRQMPSPVNAAPPHGAPETYIVKAGDTLFSIALRFHTTVDALKKLNGLTSDLIVVGQKLVVPTADGTAAPATPPGASYTVQPGDTLSRIALRFGTTTQAIEDLNGIANPNLISVGQALALPASPSLAKPGLTIDPLNVRQGGTVMIQVARPDLASVIGKMNGKTITFTRAAGYFYGVAGFSRCAKLGSVPLVLTETDISGQTTTESVNLTVGAATFPVQSITLPPGKASLLDPALINREEAQLAAIVGRYSSTRLWNGAFRQPVNGPITSQFGTRRSYNGGPVSACGHEGTDFDEDAGVPVSSDARGQVVFAGLTQVRGNMVVVDHGLGVFTGYYHLSEIDVQVGQIVEAGGLIGKVGTTGLSTGPHLHWSLFVNGDYVDPFEWTRRIIP